MVVQRPALKVYGPRCVELVGKADARSRNHRWAIIVPSGIGACIIHCDHGQTCAFVVRQIWLRSFTDCVAPISPQGHLGRVALVRRPVTWIRVSSFSESNASRTQVLICSGVNGQSLLRLEGFQRGSKNSKCLSGFRANVVPCLRIVANRVLDPEIVQPLMLNVRNSSVQHGQHAD